MLLEPCAVSAFSRGLFADHCGIYKRFFEKIGIEIDDGRGNSGDLAVRPSGLLVERIASASVITLGSTCSSVLVVQQCGDHSLTKCDLLIFRSTHSSGTPHLLRLPVLDRMDKE